MSRPRRGSVTMNPVVRTFSGETPPTELREEGAPYSYFTGLTYPQGWGFGHKKNDPAYRHELWGAPNKRIAARERAEEGLNPPKAGQEGNRAKELHNNLRLGYYGEELKNPNSPNGPVEIKKGPDGMKYACNLITGVCVLAAGIAAKHYLGLGGRTRKNRKPRRKSKKTRTAKGQS